MNFDRQPRGTFFALALIVAGTFLFLDNLGILPIEDIGAYWPLALVVYGLGALWCKRTPVSAIWHSAVILAGVLLILGNLHLVHITVGGLWPLVLIAVGATLLVDRSGWGSDWWSKLSSQDWQALQDELWPRKAARWQRKALRYGIVAGGTYARDFARQLHDDIADRPRIEERVNDVAIFFGTKRRVDTQEFEGGELVSVFGSIEIDLTLCAIRPVDGAANTVAPVRRALLEASAVFGAIEISVPRNWRIVREGVGIFGSYEDKTLPRPDAGMEPQTLVVRGGAVFGSVTIRN